MPKINLDLSDATELAQTLEFIAQWLASSRSQDALADSLAAFVGHDAYDLNALRNDLHRHMLLLGLSDRDQLLAEPTT
ncbi:MAG: hypothetical protein ABI384_09600 [Allobranchiibius sp.]